MYFLAELLSGRREELYMAFFSTPEEKVEKQLQKEQELLPNNPYQMLEKDLIPINVLQHQM